MPTTKPQTRIQAESNPGPRDNAALEFMRRYWLDKRGARTLPARADIAPSHFRKHLDAITMIDVLPGLEEFRYRLIGTAVTQYFMMDPTGSNVREAWETCGATMAARVIENLRAVARGRVCVHVCGNIDWTGRGAEAIDVLYMPFSDDGETVNMIMNVFNFNRRHAFLDRQIVRERARTTAPS